MCFHVSLMPSANSRIAVNPLRRLQQTCGLSVSNPQDSFHGRRHLPYFKFGVATRFTALHLISPCAHTVILNFQFKRGNGKYERDRPRSATQRFVVFQLCCLYGTHAWVRQFPLSQNRLNTCLCPSQSVPNLSEVTVDIDCSC